MKYIIRQKSISDARKQMVGVHIGDPVVVRVDGGDVRCIVSDCRGTLCNQCVLSPRDISCKMFRGESTTAFIPLEDLVE